ncbi:MAG TPA: hypothetical protein VLG50_05490 [Candidatus Saccharimonadales bacterium]|nr:hypothetical protein [Candidatus Saccharimonadales bacterium]
MDYLKYGSQGVFVGCAIGALLHHYVHLQYDIESIDAVVLPPLPPSLGESFIVFGLIGGLIGLMITDENKS